jgi:tetratricopeptide (TPR) repeat protein
MFRLITVLVVAVTLSVGGALGLAHQDKPAEAAPAAVGADAVAELHGKDLAAVIAGLKLRLQQVPGDAPGWATLAVAYVEQARVSGDASLYPLAVEAVKRSLEAQPEDNAAALAAKAALAAARHEFTDALDLSLQALAIDPYQPGALAIRVDALTELGRYGAQLLALDQADRRQPGLPVTTRYSYALELRGQLVGAIVLLGEAGGVTSPADQAFVSTLMADLERRRGRLAAAARHVRDALRALPGYVPALASRARLTVAEGRMHAALRQWKDVVRRLPIADYVTELGELQLVLGLPVQAAERFRAVRETNEVESSNGVNIDLEIAIFEADHGSPTVAVEAARAEWARRHSVHVADALGWALHRAGHSREALRYALLATRLGTDDARFWIHRGTIEAALGLTDAARAHLRRGLRTDPGLSPWKARGARSVLRDLTRR